MTDPVLDQVYGVLLGKPDPMVRGRGLESASDLLRLIARLVEAVHVQKATHTPRRDRSMRISVDRCRRHEDVSSF